MKVAVVFVLALLVGCASAPEPRPDVLPAPVACEVPREMVLQQVRPQPPQGDYTQADVARYLVALHQWGQEGWTRLEAVRKWSDECVYGAGSGAGGQAGSGGD